MKRLSLMVLLFILAFINMSTVKADIGPKPSVTVTIIGMEDIPYTFDLLIQEGEPFIDPDTYTENYGHYLGEDYPDELYSFETTDGYTVWSLYGHPMPTIRLVIGEEHRFIEGYHPPVEFKVLLYLEDGTTIISELVSRNYFDTTMTWDVTEVSKTVSSEGQGEISGNIHIGPYEEITGWDRLSGVSLSRLGIRVFITMAIEILTLFFFGYRTKKSYLIVGITNAVTQILLTYMVARTAAFSGYFSAVLLLLFLEAFIFVLEGVIYGNILREKTVVRAILYTLIANLATLIVGFYLVMNL